MMLKIEDIDGLLLCSECENQLRVKVYQGYAFFKVYPCTYCADTDTSESQPVHASVLENDVKIKGECDDFR